MTPTMSCPCGSFHRKLLLTLLSASVAAFPVGAQEHDSDVLDAYDRIARPFVPVSIKPVSLALAYDFLSDPDPLVRLQAAIFLRGLGDKAAGATDRLRCRLTDRNFFVRLEAAHALVTIAPEKAHLAVPCIVEGLRHPDPRMRRRIVERIQDSCLQHLVFKDLIGLLLDSDPAVIQIALRAIIACKPKPPAIVPMLVKASLCGSRETRSGIILFLGQMARPNDDKARERLSQLMDDKDDVIRAIAAISLLHVDADSEKAKACLAATLRVSDFDTRVACAMAILRNLDPNMPSAVSAIVSGIDDETCKSRTIWRMSEVASISPKILGHLSSIVTDKATHPDLHMRLIALAALRNLGSHAAPAVPGVIKLLSSENPHEVIGACRVLGAIGKPAHPAIGALTKLVNDFPTGHQVDQRALEAAFALDQIDPDNKASVQFRVQLLKHRNAEIRMYGFPHRSVVLHEDLIPHVLKCLSDPSLGNRRLAVIALRQVRKPSLETIRALAAVLEETDGDYENRVKTEALVTLATFGAESKEALPAMLRQLREGEPAVKVAAIQAVAATRVTSNEVVRAVAALIEDSEPTVRESALGAIGYFGKSASPVIQTIKSAQKSADILTKVAATRALLRLEP